MVTLMKSVRGTYHDWNAVKALLLNKALQIHTHTRTHNTLSRLQNPQFDGVRHLNREEKELLKVNFSQLVPSSSPCLH